MMDCAEVPVPLPGGGSAGRGRGRLAVWLGSACGGALVWRETSATSADALLLPERAEIILYFLLDQAPQQGPARHRLAGLTTRYQTTAQGPETLLHLQRVAALARALRARMGRLPPLLLIVMFRAGFTRADGP